LEHAARAVAANAGATGRATAPEQLHITLPFLGDFADDEAVTRASAAASRTRGTPFTLHVNHAASFGPTWFLGSSTPPQALLDLHASLSAELTNAGFEMERRAFHPHVTFLRKAARPLPAAPIPPIHWPVASFVLFDSQPALRSYRLLADWNL
jgi:2'-5' RNA ligase